MLDDAALDVEQYLIDGVIAKAEEAGHVVIPDSGQVDIRHPVKDAALPTRSMVRLAEQGWLVAYTSVRLAS
jgi:hypothetical protein